MPRSDDFMLTAEELRLRKRKRRRLIVGICAAVAFTCIAPLAARPVRNAIKGWQARRHAEKAFTLIEEANWKDARNEAVAAFQLGPEEPQALRAIARLLSRTRQPDALDFWRRLEAKSTLTRADRRDEAAIALSFGENSTAETAVRSLLDDPGNSPTPGDWLLAAQLAMQKNSVPDAQAALDRVYAHSLTSEPEQFQAVILQFALLRGEEPEKRGAHQDEAIARPPEAGGGEKQHSARCADPDRAADALAVGRHEPSGVNEYAGVGRGDGAASPRPGAAQTSRA